MNNQPKKTDNVFELFVIVTAIAFILGAFFGVTVSLLMFNLQ